jgi:hypothetical protein
MSLSEKQSSGIDIRTEGPGPPLFGAEGYRSWIEEEIRDAVKAVLEEILEAEIAAHLGAAPGERPVAGDGPAEANPRELGGTALPGHGPARRAGAAPDRSGERRLSNAQLQHWIPFTHKSLRYRILHYAA